MEKLLPLEFSFFKANTCYHIRITHDKLTLKDTYKLFNKYNYVIVGQEGELDDEKRFHQHVLVAHPFTTSLKETKRELRAVLSGIPLLPKGNTSHTITVARDKKALGSYVIKEGQYKQRGFSAKFMRALIALSYRTDTLDKKYKGIQEDLTLGLIDLRTYSNRILSLKGEHNQPIYLTSHHTAHVMSQGIRVKLVEVDKLTDLVMDRIYPENKMYS